MYRYDLNPGLALFSSAGLPLPRPPTFAVAVTVTRSIQDAKNQLEELLQLPGLRPFAVGGLTGFRFLGSENSAINQSSDISDPKASEGVFVLRRGVTVYLVEVITDRRAAAQSFLASFRTV